MEYGASEADDELEGQGGEREKLHELNPVHSFRKSIQLGIVGELALKCSTQDERPVRKEQPIQPSPPRPCRLRFEMQHR